MIYSDKVNALIQSSNLISRDLSWLQFNYRVLDQVNNKTRTIFERLKFLAITASNLDEFFMIRVGSLYNYLDYNKQRVDYSGLREGDFRIKLLSDVHEFVKEQYQVYAKELLPQFSKNHFKICGIKELNTDERKKAAQFFKKTLFPMLTPMVYDSYHTFPILMNNLQIFSIVTREGSGKSDDLKKLSFVQIPQNLPRFFEMERDNELLFIPIAEVIRENIRKLFRNVEILSCDLMRITRNGDFTLEESEDLETDFIEEIKRKLKTRRTGRVVRVEVQTGYSKWMMKQLIKRWDIDEYNIFEVGGLIDLTCLWHVIKHKNFKYEVPTRRASVPPLALREVDSDNIFQKIKKKDIVLHHPYNSPEHFLEFLEKAAEDPQVLAIKLTIYRLAKDSRVTSALLKAAENGKHVSALFELKARFDEENNIREAQQLQKAGCFVIHGIGLLKTHTKILLVVRKEGDKVTRYVHMSSGNYNEDTARLYTDISLMTTRNEYGQDVSEFFNAITGHSKPSYYDVLLTAPDEMRDKLIELIYHETENARKGLQSGIVIKINSLQDDKFIHALYEASNAGVPVKLIVRGICCLRPGRAKLSENIEVYSIVGDFLEHSRIFYYHNNGDPKVYCGSADAMVRSFDRRVESMFLFVDEQAKKEAISILDFNLKDNVNSYKMQEDGSYVKLKAKEGQEFNVHEEFFNLTNDMIENISLF
ncbi:polyphosphate kinase 1 [Rapidithrix thailandica]